MSEQQLLVRRMFEVASKGWADGTEPQMFTVDTKKAQTTDDMLIAIVWAVVLNTMAYGLEHGIAAGYRMAKSEEEST